VISPDIVTPNDILATGITIGLMAPFLEELGWTGFALPRLRKRYGVLATGPVMGLLWAAWHFPLAPGERDPEGAVPAALLVGAFLFAWLPTYRVLMVWVYEDREPAHGVSDARAHRRSRLHETPGSAVVSVLPWVALFWMIVAAVAWANGGHVTRRQDLGPKYGLTI
jgi:membrane protease YdiL (CAAX protease family)